jgi:Zn-dependent peptidase ImmA (M78 family)
MNVGERIKASRHLAGLSLRDLSSKAGVSAQAVSKYERGLDVPGSAVLIRLAQALNVRAEHLLRPTDVSLSSVRYRRHAGLGQKVLLKAQAQAQEWLERYLTAERIVEEVSVFELPQIKRGIRSLDEVEEAALELRQAWNLGLGTIDSLVEVLEARGIKVGLVDGVDGFDALTFWADDTTPVMVVKQDIPGDRQRFNLAHELGHILLEPQGELDEERVAHRFAGAFLVPAPAVESELGRKRRKLNLYELHLLKHKYGISMQAWIYRAKDVGILSEGTARRWFQIFRREGWYREEPGDRIPPERPERFDRLVLRALAEDFISETRAAELLGVPLNQFLEKARRHHGDIPLLMRG